MAGLIDTLAKNPSAFLSIVGSAAVYIDDPNFTQAVKSHFDGDAKASMFKIVGRDRIGFASIDTAPGGARFDAKISGERRSTSLPCY
ncbi:MAG: hypothetical protein H7125_16470 [Proteobacteria bacterium]|nr:hypothetical protein [Burkholderiales bacterium]